MEFASRGACLLALAAGLVFLGPACRSRKPPPAARQATFTLSGAVRDQAGQGLPGARILVFEQRDAGRPPATPKRCTAMLRLVPGVMGGSAILFLEWAMADLAGWKGRHSPGFPVPEQRPGPVLSLRESG